MVRVEGVVVLPETCWTMTEKDVLAVFPDSSLAVQFTVVVPTAKLLPETGLHITVVDADRLSVATGVEKVTFAPELSVVVAVTSVVVPKTGDVLSKVMSIVAAGLVLPRPSSSVMLKWFTVFGVKATDECQLPEPSTVSEIDVAPPVMSIVVLASPVPVIVTGVELAK